MNLNKNKSTYPFLLCAFLYIDILFSVLQYFYVNFDMVFYSVINVLSCIWFMRFHSFRDSKSFKGIAVFGIFMSCMSIIGIFISRNPLHAVQISYYLLCPLFFYILGYNSSPIMVRRVLFYLLLTVFCFTLLERLEFWAGINLFNLTEFSANMKYAAISDTRDLSVGRATGVFLNANQLGFFAGSIMFSIFALAPGRSKRDIVVFALATITLFLSGSRGSILALVMASAVYLSRKRSATIILAVLFSVFLLYLLYIYFMSHGTSGIDAFTYRLMFESGNANESVSGRMSYWLDIFNRVNIFTGTLQPPELALGHAIDSFYMKLLAQAGIFGLASGIFLLFAFYAEQRAPSSRFSNAGALSLLVFVAINSVSMLGLLDLEAVSVWVVFGCIARCNQSAGIRHTPRLRTRKT